MQADARLRGRMPSRRLVGTRSRSAWPTGLLLHSPRTRRARRSRRRRAPRAAGHVALGPFYLTPKFRIGTIGLDTNVLYTPTDRTTDISGSGGPGLELALPVGGSSRFSARPSSTTSTSSRRSRSAGSRDRPARLRVPQPPDVVPPRGVMDRLLQPANLRGQQRVRQKTEATRFDFTRRLFGRVSLLAQGGERGPEAPSDTGLPGHRSRAHLDARRLSRGRRPRLRDHREDVVRHRVRRAVVPLPARQPARREHEPGLGRLSNRPTALIAGRAMVGRRSYEFDNVPVSGAATVASVDAMIGLSPKTRFGGSYNRDLSYSVLPTVDRIRCSGTRATAPVSRKSWLGASTCASSGRSAGSGARTR